MCIRDRRGHITASQGDRDRLLVDDASIGTGRDLELANQPGLNEYFLYYDLPVYTTANSQVVYTCLLYTSLFRGVFVGLFRIG